MTTIGGPKITDVGRHVTFETSYFIYLADENPTLIDFEEGGLTFGRASRIATRWSIRTERRRHATHEAAYAVLQEELVPGDDAGAGLAFAADAGGDYLARHTRRVSSMVSLLAQAAGAPLWLFGDYDCVFPDNPRPANFLRPRYALFHALAPDLWPRDNATPPFMVQCGNLFSPVPLPCLKAYVSAPRRVNMAVAESFLLDGGWEVVKPRRR